jgi:hypothetical protein
MLVTAASGGCLLFFVCPPEGGACFSQIKNCLLFLLFDQYWPFAILKPKNRRSCMPVWFCVSLYSLAVCACTRIRVALSYTHWALSIKHCAVNPIIKQLRPLFLL